jgi:UDP-2,3-diacylglucosamine hydrolase
LRWSKLRLASGLSTTPDLKPGLPLPPPGSLQPGSLPPFFELPTPSTWRAIDFISDLHLSENTPRTFAALTEHLRATTADAVFILGDLFELWVGDDMRQRGFEQRCANMLSEVSSHRSLAFMVGNRDFLAAGALLRDTGMVGLPDPTVLLAWSQRVLLTHGDALCVTDLPYQAFRAKVRAPEWQAGFLTKPLDERLQVAAQVRSASATSAQRRSFDGDVTVDLDATTAVLWMHSMGTPEMVHGHTHRPGSSILAPGFKRHVLSDWDLDGAARAEVLRLDRDGFSRMAPLRV